jgi:hypothetical protein
MPFLFGRRGISPIQDKEGVVCVFILSLYTYNVLTHISPYAYMFFLWVYIAKKRKRREKEEYR